MHNWFGKFNGVSEELKGAFMENMNKLENDQEYKESEDAVLDALFDEHDVNKDGLLNCVEYCNWA